MPRVAKLTAMAIRFDGLNLNKPAGPLVPPHHDTPLWFKHIYVMELK